VPNALVSRSVILKLEPLSVRDILQALDKGLAYLENTGCTVVLSETFKEELARRSGGDLRRALTSLESLAAGHSQVTITQEMLDEVFYAAPLNYDRTGDQHYDITSAFIKSMRGSDPDATLYWLARLIHSGEDPRFIARRMMIHASEDVGLADNSALQTAVAAAQAVEKIGYPEARIILAHAALHIARAPKSNSAYRGISLALEAVTRTPIDVPPYLRDAHYKGAAKLGHVGYQFPHDTPTGWVDQAYAPGITAGSLYQSDARDAPTFESRADTYWAQLTKTHPKKRF
jgi:putative ATPase